HTYHSSAFSLLFSSGDLRSLHSFPTRRSSDLFKDRYFASQVAVLALCNIFSINRNNAFIFGDKSADHRNQRTFPRSIRTDERCRSEEHTSELQSRFDLVCRLLLEKKKYNV